VLRATKRYKGFEAEEAAWSSIKPKDRNVAKDMEVNERLAGVTQEIYSK
jgi:hypothetical protein